MSKIVSVHSYRGGTGKSNLTANLTCTVASQGFRVGVIDTDIHSPGIHVLFHVHPSEVNYSLNDFLHERCPIEDAAIDVTETLKTGSAPVHENAALYLIPSSVETGEIARILNEGYDVALLNDGIRTVIERLNLDFLFIDTHPGVNEETLLSIAISDILFLILRPDQQDFQGTGITVDLARQLEVRKMYLVLNKALNVMDPEALSRKAESIFDATVASVLPLSEEIVRLGSDGVFCLLQPDHPYSTRVASIADLVLDKAPQASG